MDETKIRKVFLDDLPHRKRLEELVVNWKKSVGCSVAFIYNDINGIVKIIDYLPSSNPRLKILYNKKEYEISVTNFIKCKLGKLLNKITSEFKIEIGQVFKDNNRDLIIINKEYRIEDGKRKYYKYHCNKCKAELWAIESAILNQKQSCACCSNKTVVEGINDITTTDDWMIPIINDMEFCKTHTHSCSAKFHPTCPTCGITSNKLITVNSLYGNNYICPICSDGFSYPNKFMFNLLSHLNIEFQSEKRFDWCTYKINNKDTFGIYDFYIPSMSLIVEMDGGLGHGNKAIGNNKNSIKESILKDDYKNNLAKENGFKIIRIDCNYKNNMERFEYIKDNIINSELKKCFNLYDIDWNKIELNCEKSLVREVCDYYNKNTKISVTELSKTFNINETSVREYLKRGTNLKWCYYNSKEKIKFEVFDNKDKSLGIFYSFIGLEKESEKLFGTKLRADDISKVCRGVKSQYKGFTFKYVEDENNIQSA